MEIRWQFNGRVFCLCIGHQTKWFSQAPWITLVEEFHVSQDNGMTVTTAKILWKKY